MKSPRGEKVFSDFFSEVYGENWTDIYSALKESGKKVARGNLFFGANRWKDLKVRGLLSENSEAPHCFDIDDSFSVDDMDFPILPFYRMDPASIFAALALNTKPGDHVLDMCAAPGGKTLVLLEMLTAAQNGEPFEVSGQLVANELSPKRRHRMMSVFKRYLPKEVRSLIQITGTDGSRIGLSQKEIFDRILLDAPCSGERGVVLKANDLAEWKPKRTKSFAIRQYSLLASAFMALKSGGRIVYSTCSISPHENDGVIEKLLKRKKGEVEIVEPEDHLFSTRTEYGLQFLPHKHGWGPIYFCVIEKL